MMRTDVKVAACCARAEAPNSTEFRFQFREHGGLRRIFTAVFDAEQFANALTARVVEGVTLEIRERINTAIPAEQLRQLRAAGAHALKVLTWIQESNPEGDDDDRRVLNEAIAELTKALGTEAP